MFKCTSFCVLFGINMAVPTSGPVKTKGTMVCYSNKTKQSFS